MIGESKGIVQRCHAINILQDRHLVTIFKSRSWFILCCLEYCLTLIRAILEFNFCRHAEHFQQSCSIVEDVEDDSVLLFWRQFGETEAFIIDYHIGVPPIHQSESLLSFEAAETTGPFCEVIDGDQIAVKALESLVIRIWLAVRLWPRLPDKLIFVQAIAVICITTHQSLDRITFVQRLLVYKLMELHVPCLINFIWELLKARLEFNLSVAAFFEVPLNSSLCFVIFDID